MRLIALVLIVLLSAVAPVAADGAKVERVEIRKSERLMRLLAANGGEIRRYTVALGKNPVGAKKRIGDKKTPEGVYVITGRNPQSKYHLSLHISYPNKTDRARARRQGVNPGGLITIHGLSRELRSVGAAHTAHDWTDGCIAVTNAEIEEIWSLVPVGTAVHILP